MGFNVLLERADGVRWWTWCKSEEDFVKAMSRDGKLCGDKVLKSGDEHAAGTTDADMVNACQQTPICTYLAAAETAFERGEIGETDRIQLQVNAMLDFAFRLRDRRERRQHKRLT